MADAPAVFHYRTLDARLILETAERLTVRIGERFPESGLRRVAGELVALTREQAAAAAGLAQPLWWLRAVIGIVVLTGIVMFVFVGTILPLDRMSGDSMSESMQGIEASLNTFILVGLGLVALVRLEDWIKRKRVFTHLHRLRTLIHVIDMHQLTKDPAALSEDFRPTEHSPQRITNPQDLARYLDYCSEMLSLTGKLAALFAQAVNDEVVVDAVNDLEELGTTLSRKIWQKITLIEGRR